MNITQAMTLASFAVTGVLSGAVTVHAGAPGLTSFDTGYTITKVRAAQDNGVSYVVASSYEGTVLGLSHNGKRLWENALSGFMNRDVWCEDITGDGADEILAANADGTLYCLDEMGKLRWKFKANDAPMNAVSVVRHNGAPYVVCGGYDMNLYYLTAQGKPVKTIASSTYSVAKPWGRPGGKRFPKKNRHIANFIRTVRGPDGKEALAVHGMLNSNSTTGSIYLFKPMADKPFHTIPMLAGSKPYGDFSISDINGDGVDEITLGSSTSIQKSTVIRIDLKDYGRRVLSLANFRRQVGGNGYRVAQTVSFGAPGKPRFLTAFGSRLIVSLPDFDTKKLEFLTCGYSFNDLWKDPNTGRILLASAQSGGSCIHVLDTSIPQWKGAYRSFQPAGKLKAILDSTAAARRQLQSFKAPTLNRARRPVYLMTEKLTGDVERLALELEEKYGSPVFLNTKHMPVAEDWDRSTVGSEQYRKRRDRRRKYTLTQKQALDQLLPLYDTARKGVAFWGGHGNDPYMFSTDTMMRIADSAKGKMSVFIYPELEHYDDDFALVLKQHFYPMAEYFRDRNARIYVRTKHSFWQCIVYMPLWSRLLSGEFADVFVPSMEETTDKTMEQSVAGRVGIWASGAANQWGSRGARDNASFDRLRQHSHQMIPNHFLRAQIYNIAYGATYQNNYPVNQDYFSILYELIAKGVLYVPKRNEIVSFNPVHLSMAKPDERYIDEGHNVKWLTFYDAESEKNNPMVFSRLNGTWPGAPVTEWDFSRYAAGVKDRRLNFLPPYEHGLVLITPPQDGAFAGKTAPRGRLTDHLHPLYRNIMREYLTDGRHYYSSDGKQTYPANEHYKVIEADIKASAGKLPLTVSGNVAWVAAQSAPKHIRLTLIDSGYIDPGDKAATITFNAVTPVAMTDILSGERIAVGKTACIEVLCGLFRFMDIEIKQEL